MEHDINGARTAIFITKGLVFQNSIYYDDIEIDRGVLTFINGPSGSGKSTLFQLFNATKTFTSGEIFYKEKKIATFDTIALRREVKLISQTTFLFPGTILENFRTFYQYCDYTACTSEEHMRRFLEMAHAPLDLDRLCDVMSGGERHRVYIAICLSMEAQTILLDEPTAALDDDIAHTVMRNITQYIRDNNKTLVVISHDSALVTTFAEKVITLTGGIERGTCGAN